MSTSLTAAVPPAFAAARARRVLGALPERVDAFVSGNIIKNVKSIVVPNTGGLRGIPAAVAAGLVAGDDARTLEVLEGVTFRAPSMPVLANVTGAPHSTDPSAIRDAACRTGTLPSGRLGSPA